MKKITSLAAVFLATIISIPTQSFAVGSGAFENASFGAGDYGKGTAATANPTNPATISINPAGITELPGVQIQSNMNFINMWTEIESSRANGGSTQSSGTTVPVPTMYMTVNPGERFGLNNRLAFGIGTDAPFGLMNKYDSNFTAVRYTGYRNWIKMFAIKPVASFKFADWLSIGGGPIYYRAFDVGQIARYPNFGLAGSGLVGAATPDGQVRANMSGNGWGWQLGFLAKPHPKHKFGYYFRSPTKIDLKGQLKGENIADVVGGTSANGRFETGVHAKMHLPFNMTWGYNYKFNEKTDAGIDFGWTRWSVFDNFYVPVDSVNSNTFGALMAGGHTSLLNSLFNSAGAGGAGDKDWGNAFTLAVGGEHKFTDRFRIRSGAYYYWTPIPKGHFTPSIPDANRITATLGFGYDITEWLTWDVAYAAQFFANRTVNNEISESLGTSVDGKYKSFLHVWTTGLTMKFDGTTEEPKVEDWEGSTVG